MKTNSVLTAICAGAMLFAGCSNKDAAPIADAKPAEEEAGAQVTRDDKGNVVIKIGDEMQGEMGLLVAQPAAMSLSPEVKGFGRVVDPAPLGEMLMELGKAQLIYDTSHKELERMKILKKDNNTSQRAFETAEAAYRQNGADAGTVWFKIQKNFGNRIAEMSGPMVVPPGTQRKWDPVLDAIAGARGAFLVRVDLPASEVLTFAPASVRIVALGESAVPVKADFFGDVPAVDPQTQARGYFFLLYTNTQQLTPGIAVTAFIQSNEQSQSGVIIPREAVVRKDGAGWIYFADSSGEAYVRTEIALDHPTDAGWFVTKGVTASDHIVVTGAAQLLSEELKAQLGGD
jgi:PBP1b-binding outer membrane lipoprotein LpoB